MVGGNRGEAARDRGAASGGGRSFGYAQGRLSKPGWRSLRGSSHQDNAVNGVGWFGWLDVPAMNGWATNPDIGVDSIAQPFTAGLKEV